MLAPNLQVAVKNQEGYLGHKGSPQESEGHQSQTSLPSPEYWYREEESPQHLAVKKTKEKNVGSAMNACVLEQDTNLCFRYTGFWLKNTNAQDGGSRAGQPSSGSRDPGPTTVRSLPTGSGRAEAIGGCRSQGAERVPQESSPSAHRGGAGRPAPDRSSAGGRRESTGGYRRAGVAKGQYGAEAGAWPCLPRAVPVFLRRWLLGDSICQRSVFLSPPPSARPRSASGGGGERGTRRGEPISCQASDEAARRRRETHKERGERRRRRRRRMGAANSGQQLPAVPAGAATAGSGSEATETMRPGSECWRPRSPGSSLTVPRLIQAPPGPSPPGKGAPPRSRDRRRKWVRGRRARQLASREKFAAPPRGGAARPWRPRSPPVTFWTRR
ncbi:uncharacterized protein LOC141571791 [Rhinolophus sinicus]|uniref:uncharacterized protein LOC141571791 n=1 Tax=Rhinolophus sinicus TaxID=89399 RepID=UPI003D7AEE93